MSEQLTAAQIEKELKKLQAQMAKQQEALEKQLEAAKTRETALETLRADLEEFAHARGVDFVDILSVLNGEVKKPRKPADRRPFTNPANPNEVYSGSGKKGGWLKDLMKEAGTDNYKEFLALVQPKAEEAQGDETN